MAGLVALGAEARFIIAEQAGSRGAVRIVAKRAFGERFHDVGVDQTQVHRGVAAGATIRHPRAAQPGGGLVHLVARGARDGFGRVVRGGMRTENRPFL